MNRNENGNTDILKNIRIAVFWYRTDWLDVSTDIVFIALLIMENPLGRELHQSHESHRWSKGRRLWLPLPVGSLQGSK
jgi:hypothetical protein